MITIKWVNEPEVTYEDSDAFADMLEDTLSWTGFQFLVRGYDDDGRYNQLIGYDNAKEDSDAER